MEEFYLESSERRASPPGVSFFFSLFSFSFTVFLFLLLLFQKVFELEPLLLSPALGHLYFVLKILGILLMKEHLLLYPREILHWLFLLIHLLSLLLLSLLLLF